MPVLANARHELYCSHRAKGMAPAKAAIAAGFATGSAVYSSLEKDADIINRIQEKMDEIKLFRDQRKTAALEAARTVGKMTGYSRAWVLTQLAELASSAKADGDYAEANTALKMIGQHLGMFKGNTNEKDDENDVPSHLDMDTTEALLNGADAALQNQIPPGAPQKDFDLENAMKLIGQTGKNTVDPHDRKLPTDSETIVAHLDDEETD